MMGQLCSQRDPVREASQWLELQQVSAGHFWILGLGAGYHVAEMVKRYPEHVISVIDHRSELNAEFEKNFPECSHHVRIEIVQSEAELMDCQSYRLFGGTISSQHLFRPAISMSPDLYSLFSKVLRGQTRDSFRFLCQHFGISINEICLASISEFQIKEIATAVEAQGRSEARGWIRVLRELVA